ncbi:hypothetical protein [Candidatus Colwellia aromaticivorans]|uniref:hypothetical protein n=1 Tax=Candidatus Colwellia aromaticivorans TaxID=2267621 RepID=UPI000DF4AA15|nr:hypothetical protein [Candidatus Colwellia aromaticivorans]
MIQNAKVTSNLSLLLFLLVVQVVFKTDVAYANEVQLTDKQARALQSLNTEPQSETTKSLRLKITMLQDNRGQKYLGALVSRAELLPYLTQLQQLLAEDFNQYRALQAARDHQLFHLTILNPREYQLADKAIIEELLLPDFNQAFSSQLSVTLIGLGKVVQENKESFFVVAQSADAQLIRQRFILPSKDFHITLGFNPGDIYGVKKDRTTLID